MSHAIGTPLDETAHARLHFTTMTQQEQATAIRRMAADGAGDYTIAGATGLSVEMVRRILGKRGREATPETW